MASSVQCRPKNAVAPLNVYNLIPRPTNASGQPLEDIFAGARAPHQLCAAGHRYPLTVGAPLPRATGRSAQDIHFFGQALFTELYKQGERRTHGDQRTCRFPPFPSPIPSFRRRWHAFWRPAPTRPRRLACSDRFYSFGYRQLTKPTTYLSVRRRAGRHVGRYHDLGTLWQPWPDHDQLFEHRRGALQRHPAIA